MTAIEQELSAYLTNVLGVTATLHQIQEIELICKWTEQKLHEDKKPKEKV